MAVTVRQRQYYILVDYSLVATPLYYALPNRLSRNIEDAIRFSERHEAERIRQAIDKDLKIVPISQRRRESV